MRSRPDNLHRSPVAFRGAGTVFVDDATAKLLRAGAIGWAVSLVPCAMIAAAILPAGSPLFLGVIGGLSFVGWTIGLLVGAFVRSGTRKEYRDE